MSYLQIIRLVKQAPEGFVFYSMTDETEEKLSKLQLFRCINVHWQRDKSNRYGLCATIPHPETNDGQFIVAQSL